MSRELTYHRTRLVRSDQLTPHLRRIVLSGDELDGWSSSGVPDEAVLLAIPDATGAVDVPGPHNDHSYDNCRWYTVRHFDADRGELTIDVVGHDIGLATRWTRRAHPGDEVAVSSVRHWYALPADARWQLLVGDITAVPAIARMLDERPDVPTVVRIEISDPRDEVPLAAADHVSIEWVHNAGPSRLDELTRSADLPAGPGYTFAAGEAAATRGVRRYLRHELGLPTARYSVVGYWRDRSEEWFEKYRESGIDLEAIYAAGEAAGKDAEELADEVDRHLLAAGL
ncbi:MAG: siderophore-interacting protein [Nocardioidaceae bacterium]